MVSYVSLLFDNDDTPQKWRAKRGVEGIDGDFDMIAFVSHDADHAFILCDAVKEVAETSAPRAVELQKSLDGRLIILRFAWPELERLMDIFYHDSAAYRGHPEYRGKEARVEDDALQERRPHVVIGKVPDGGDVDMAIGVLNDWVPSFFSVYSSVVRADGLTETYSFPVE